MNVPSCFVIGALHRVGDSGRRVSDHVGPTLVQACGSQVLMFTRCLLRSIDMIESR
jgi:hypothetical protein